MKKFWEKSKKPLKIAIIATIGCLIDFLIAGLFVKGASFTWVGFIVWTVFFGATVSDRIRGFIGVLIGFLAAVIMMFISKSFTLNVWIISISVLLGVFLINGLVMYLENTKKFWTNSISGIFVGISLTFSGLGIGLNPLNNVKEAFIMLAIIAIYTVLGLLYGLFSIIQFKRKENQTKK